MIEPVSLITVGIGDWERWTLPLINSIRDHEPDVPIIVIANGAEPAYPFTYLARIIHTPRMSYPAAMNTGIIVAPPSGYYIVINNDVLCTGSFTEKVIMQGQDVLAGNWLNEKFGRKWIDSWHWCIPVKVWQTIGQFDEEYEICGFEDADYCFRAEKEGFTIAQSHHPFIHLEGRIRFTLDGYGEQRRKNLNRLMDKFKLRKQGWHEW
jgi:hypothetical protein